MAHVKPSAAVNPPSLSGIARIDVSYDLTHNGTDPWAVRYRLLLEQGGNYYAHVPGDLIFQGGWQSFAHTGLLATDFQRVTEFDTSTERPDFSSSGAPITLGFRASNHHSGSNTQFRWSGLDNWSVTVHGGPVSIDDESWGRVKALFR